MTAPLAGRRPAEVLLVEDSENDVFLLRAAFKQARFPIQLHIVENGLECLAFLRKEGRYGAVPTPDIVLLDLNLPVMDGRQVLTTLVADPQFRSLPVVVLTTSANPEDIQRMYDLRCSTYIVKPLDFDEFERTIRLIGEYWFGAATLPSEMR